jgi:hypothetical protein
LQLRIALINEEEERSIDELPNRELLVLNLSHNFRAAFSLAL